MHKNITITELLKLEKKNKKKNQSFRIQVLKCFSYI